MALSRAIEEKLSSPPNFGKLLMLSLFLGTVVFLLQTSPVGIATLRMPVVRLRMIDASGPSAQQPVHDPEAGMSASELMQRWEPMISDAARRFKIPAAWIRNVMRSESGGRMTLRVASPGEVLGLSAVLAGGPYEGGPHESGSHEGGAYEATAEVMEPVQVARVRRGDLLHFLREHAEICMQVVNLLSADLHEAYGQVRTVGLTRTRHSQSA